MEPTADDLLRASMFAMPADDVRTAVRRIDEATVRALPGRARPLMGQLRRAPDPLGTLRRLPDLSVITMVADLLTDDCLNAFRDELGDDADDPSREQLVAAVDPMLERFGAPAVRLTLAMVAVTDAEAAELCRSLLVEDERVRIDVPVRTTPTITTAAAKEPVSDEVKAQRKARKAERKAKAPAPVERQRYRKGSKPTSATHEPASSSSVPIASRRSPTDVPAGFDIDDPLVGMVVIADIPFDDEVGAKTRPAVVLAANADELFVRPGYSDGGLQSRRWQSHALRDWAAAGLHEQTWIEDGARTIARSDAHADPLGRVADDDWNALF